MASEWERSSLADAGVALIDCDHRTPPAAESGYPYIAIPQLKDGRVDLKGVRRISREHYAEWTRKLRPQSHDVVVVRRCNSGESAVVPEGLECAIGQNLIVLRANGSRVLPEYLRWLVRGDEWWAEVRKYVNVGAVFDSLKCREIPNFEVFVPPRPEQRAIASLLTCIDDRINLLRETNVTLEAIAQAFFKSWFVDFDPVRARVEGREPVGIDTTTAALFPGEFDASGTGLIPHGWQSSKIGSVVELVKGCSYKGAGLSDSDGAFMFNLGCFSERRVYASENVKRYTGSFRQNQTVSAGDLIIANTDLTQARTVLGRPLLVPPGHSPGFISHHVFKVVIRSDLAEQWRVYLFFAFQQPAFRERAVGHASGTTVLSLPRDAAEQCPLIVPSEPVLRAFYEIASPLLGRILSNDHTSKSLARLRDVLIPRLISGKLRLPQSEAMLEATMA